MKQTDEKYCIEVEITYPDGKKVEDKIIHENVELAKSLILSVVYSNMYEQKRSGRVTVSYRITHFHDGTYSYFDSDPEEDFTVDLESGLMRDCNEQVAFHSNRTVPKKDTQKTPYPKPPLGVPPMFIVEECRIQELAEAIIRQVTEIRCPTDFKLIEKWAREIYERSLLVQRETQNEKK